MITLIALPDAHACVDPFLRSYSLVSVNFSTEHHQNYFFFVRWFIIKKKTGTRFFSIICLFIFRYAQWQNLFISLGKKNHAPICISTFDSSVFQLYQGSLFKSLDKRQIRHGWKVCVVMISRLQSKHIRTCDQWLFFFY